jgi:hypothetical protein
MTPTTARRIIKAINIVMVLVIITVIGYFAREAYRLFGIGETVGGWMAVFIAAVFLAICILGWFTNREGD